MCADIQEVRQALVKTSNPTLNNNKVALYCATLYLTTTDSLLSYISQNRFVDTVFIKKLATDFGNQFFNAYNFRNNSDSLSKAWHFAYLPIETQISEFQLLLLGINAHINCDLYAALVANYSHQNKKVIAHDFFLIDQIFLDVTQAIVAHIFTAPGITEADKKMLKRTINHYKSLGTYCRKRAFQSAKKTVIRGDNSVKRIVNRNNRRANRWAYFIIHPKWKMKKSINIIAKFEHPNTNENLKLFFP